jgi:hypothetical protein
MTGFNAATVVEALDYTFEPYVPSCHGTIKEPSDEQIIAFMEDMKALFAEGSQKGLKETERDARGNPDPADLLAGLDALNPADTGAMMKKMNGVFAALCSGKPTAIQIGKLPLRRRAAFFAWLQSEAISPEAGTGAGNGQLIRLPSAAAG